MTTITEAVFKGRNRRVIPTSSDSMRHNPQSTSSQFMSRRAIEAVLAGGYTRADEPHHHHASPSLNSQPVSERRKYVRDAVIWIFIFAVAGVIGIASSHLPGHAVKAKPAERQLAAQAAAPAAVVQAELKALAATPPSAPAPAPAAPAAVQPPMVAASPAPSPSEVAMVVPAPRPAVLHPVSKGAGLIAAVPDSEPLNAPPVAARAAVTNRAPSAPKLPLDEVLYEGEPSAAAQQVAPAGSVAVVTPRTALSSPAAVPAAAPSEDAPQTNTSSALRVEGIFGDKVRPLALINGSIVEVGKRVGTMTVLEIKPGVVILDDNGSRLALHLQ